jgi:hypothetical protein
VLDRVRKKSLEVEAERIGVPVASLEPDEAGGDPGPTVFEAVAA